MVEQLIRNQQVSGSIPLVGSNKISGLYLFDIAIFLWGDNSVTEQKV
jgi:hypothetical protein